MTAAEVQRHAEYERSALQTYRETDLKMRQTANEIDLRRYQIEQLEREIKELEGQLRLLVRLPRESHGKWSRRE